MIEPAADRPTLETNDASSLPPVGNREVQQIAETLLGEGLELDELSHAARGAGSWLWDGYLAAGKITLFSSQWKSGKTTLISVLLARMEQGGQLAGLPVARGRAAIISEEGPENWDARCRQLKMGKHLKFFCRPFKTKPTAVEWEGMLQAMLLLRQSQGLDLVVIDTLTSFMPGDNENSAGAVMRCLLPLRLLTAQGIGVLLVHHPKKGHTLPGQAARGSGALPSHADIIMEMNWYRHPDDDDRRRWLRTQSRHSESRRRTIIELTADGSDYLVHTAPPGGESPECWDVLSIVLGDAWDRLTQKEILEGWPEDFVKPDQTTLARALRRGLEQNLILRQGSGHKGDPYRYWLPGMEEDLHPGERASSEDLQRWNTRCMKKHWAAHGWEWGDAAEDTAKEAEKKTPEATSAEPPATNDLEPTSPAAPESIAMAPTPSQSAEPIQPTEEETREATTSQPLGEPRADARGPTTWPGRETEFRGVRSQTEFGNEEKSTAKAPKPRRPAKAKPPRPSPIADSPTEPQIIETAPLPAAIVRAAPEPDPALVAAERARLRRWPS